MTLPSEEGSSEVDAGKVLDKSRDEKASLGPFSDECDDGISPLVGDDERIFPLPGREKRAAGLRALAVTVRRFFGRTGVWGCAVEVGCTGKGGRADDGVGGFGGRAEV